MSKNFYQMKIEFFSDYDKLKYRHYQEIVEKKLVFWIWTCLSEMFGYAHNYIELLKKKWKKLNLESHIKTETSQLKFHFRFLVVYTFNFELFQLLKKFHIFEGETLIFDIIKIIHGKILYKIQISLLTVFEINGARCILHWI